MPRVSHRFVADRPIDATELPIGPLRICYDLAAVAGDTRFQRDLDFPELGPQIMAPQSQAGVASLARLAERQIPA